MQDTIPRKHTATAESADEAEQAERVERTRTGQQHSRTLHALAELARAVNCGQCWQRPGRPCTVSGPGDHLARYLRAERRGLITRAELAAVVASLDVIARSVIIRDGAR